MAGGVWDNSLWAEQAHREVLGCRAGYSWPYGAEWPEEPGNVLAPGTVSLLLLHSGSASLLNTAIVAFIGTTAAIALFQWRLLTV